MFMYHNLDLTLVQYFTVNTFSYNDFDMQFVDNQDRNQMADFKDFFQLVG